MRRYIDGGTGMSTDWVFFYFYFFWFWFSRIRVPGIGLAAYYSLSEPWSL